MAFVVDLTVIRPEPFQPVFLSEGDSIRRVVSDEWNGDEKAVRKLIKSSHC